MEAADQEKTESYKVIFLFYFMWYLFALIIRMVFFTVSQELEEKMRTLEALFQEKNSDYQVIFDYCMRYYQHIQLFLSSFNQELDKKIRAMETSTSIGQSNYQVIFDCYWTLYHISIKNFIFFRNWKNKSRHSGPSYRKRQGATPSLLIAHRTLNFKMEL